MAFRYRYRVRFRDTDGAGVVFFARVFAICHDAYEASLLAAGVDVQKFFLPRDLACPIVHADCDYFRPMRCGELYEIALTPMQQRDSEFSITYDLAKIHEPLDRANSDRANLSGAANDTAEVRTNDPANDATDDAADRSAQTATAAAYSAPHTLAARAWTRHVAINPGDRQRVNLPPPLLTWIQNWQT